MDWKKDEGENSTTVVMGIESERGCTSPKFIEPNESAPLLGNSPESLPYGSIPRNWSSTGAMLPYTRETRPKRLPYNIPRPQRNLPESDGELYFRVRYYSRLRAQADFTEHALVMPEHLVPEDLFIPYIPGHVQNADGKQDSFITVVAIWNTMMGTSLLTMPWAFGQAGFLGGFIIMLGMAGLCLYTAYRMLTLQKIMGLEGEMHEVAFLCRFLWTGGYGKVIEGLAVTFSVLTLFGALIVYWVLMSNFLFNTGAAIHDAIFNDSGGNITGVVDGLLCPPNMTSLIDDFDTIAPPVPNNWWRLDLSVPIYLIVPFIFLLNIRNMKIFTYFNSLGGISVFAVYTFVIYKSVSWGMNFTLTDTTSPFYVPLFKDTFMALSGTLSLAYFIHNCVISIMKGNRYPSNNARDLTLAYILVMLTYIPIGVFFYLSFPLPKYCLVDNFLNNFPPHNTILAVVRSFLLFQILTVFPLLTCFTRSQISCYFFGPSSKQSFLQITIINIILVSCCVLVAIFYPNIGFIIRWVGAMTGLAYVFVLPCVSYLQALHSKSTLDLKTIIPHTILILVGIGNFVAQFFLS